MRHADWRHLPGQIGCCIYRLSYIFMQYSLHSFNCDCNLHSHYHGDHCSLRVYPNCAMWTALFAYYFSLKSQVADIYVHTDVYGYILFCLIYQYWLAGWTKEAIYFGSPASDPHLVEEDAEMLLPLSAEVFPKNKIHINFPP